MSHSNIYKNSSKSSLLSSKTSLQEQSTSCGFIQNDTSSRASLHDRSSRGSIHNKSSRTSLGLPSLHLSSMDDTDVFLETSIEKPLQKSSSSIQQSSLKKSTSGDHQVEHRMLLTSQMEDGMY